jgi:hypothetical protein
VEAGRDSRPEQEVSLALTGCRECQRTSHSYMSRVGERMETAFDHVVFVDAVSGNHVPLAG